MTKITGRPPKAVKLEKFIGYFVTNAQHANSQEKAAQAKVNIFDYIRQMAVNGYVRIRWTYCFGPDCDECFSIIIFRICDRVSPKTTKVTKMIYPGWREV